jgi:hypothetical protein
MTKGSQFSSRQRPPPPDDELVLWLLLLVLAGTIYVTKILISYALAAESFSSMIRIRSSQFTISGLARNVTCCLIQL